MKKTIFLFLFLCISFSSITQQTNMNVPIRERIQNLQARVDAEYRIYNQLNDIHPLFRQLRDEAERLRVKAIDIRKKNVLKMGMRGLMEVYDKFTIAMQPALALTALCSDIIGQTLAKPAYNKVFEKVDKEKKFTNDTRQSKTKLTNLQNLLRAVLNENSTSSETNKLLMRVIKAPVSDFSNKVSTFQNIAELNQFWRGSDRTEIAQEEDVVWGFRKMECIIFLATKARNQADDDRNRVRNEQARLVRSIRSYMREIERLGGMIDEWDPTPETPPQITVPANPQPKKNNSYAYTECLNPRTGEGPRPAEERNKRTELLKMYYENGYRFDTYLVTNFLDEVYLGQKIELENYKIDYANPYIKNPYGVYRYSHEFFVDGIKSKSNYPFSDLTNMRSGKPGKHTITVVMKSCDDIIEEYEHEVLVKNPIFDATIYFKDPESEVSQGRAYITSFNPEIDHPSIEDAEINLSNYTCYVYFDDEHLTVMEKKPSLRFDPLGTYTPGQELLTPGKHEIRIELWDNHTHTFVDQYLHHVTVTEGGGTTYIPPQVQKPTDQAKKYGQIKEQTYDPDLEGKRVPVLRIQWANYDYVFKNGEIKIDGFYYWNYQKVMYTSEPILSYVKGATNVPGMVLTNTSGYHIYPTTPSPGNPCSNMIITQMKGADIKILHRIKACDFNMNIAPDKSKITIKYRSSVAGESKMITLL